MDEVSQERVFDRRCTPIHADASEMDRRSGIVIGCAFRVMNTLGVGFTEKVYENALAHEVRKAGLCVVQQQRIVVHYDEIVVGEYAADLMVDDMVLVELKAVQALNDQHVAQCINCLAATGLHLCLLLNFGKSRVQLQRVVHDFRSGTPHPRASAYIGG